MIEADEFKGIAAPRIESPRLRELYFRLSARAPLDGKSLEEPRNRCLKGARELIEARRTHPIRAAFIFLELLEREANQSGQLTLADATDGSKPAEPRADMGVDGGRLPLRHLVAPSRSGFHLMPHDFWLLFYLHQFCVNNSLPQRKWMYSASRAV